MTYANAAAKTLCLALILCASATLLEAQDFPVNDFDAYVAQAVEEWRVPGLAISVIKDGEVVFARGYGVRSLDAPDEVTTQTLFAIGSTTKAMTAAALGLLVATRRPEMFELLSNHYFKADNMTEAATALDHLSVSGAPDRGKALKHF